MHLAHDFNIDNKIDILTLRYWSHDWYKALSKYKNSQKTFDGGPQNLYNAKNGEKNTLSFNNSGFSHPINKEHRWTFDALITDLNHDNQDELFVANDFGSDTIFNFNKSGKFFDVTKQYFFPDRRNGMSIASNYLPNNPYPYIYVSNIFIENYVEKGNFYWHYNPRQKKLKDLANKVNLDNCRWAWGASFADFNLDGYSDVYIANGFLSSKEGSNKKGNFKFASLATLPFAEASKKFEAVMQPNDEGIPLEINANGTSVSGNQKDCLRLYDAKQGMFVDYSKDGTLDLAWDGRAVSTIDYDNDGDLDLLVTTQNNYLRLLKNNLQETEQTSNWIGFEIKNQQFLRRITIYQGSRTYYKDWNAAHSGFLATSDPRIHFGLISDHPITVVFEFVDKHQVTKPNLKTGKYYNLGKL